MHLQTDEMPAQHLQRVARESRGQPDELPLYPPLIVFAVFTASRKQRQCDGEVVTVGREVEDDLIRIRLFQLHNFHAIEIFH